MPLALIPIVISFRAAAVMSAAAAVGGPFWATVGAWEGSALLNSPLVGRSWAMGRLAEATSGARPPRPGCVNPVLSRLRRGELLGHALELSSLVIDGNVAGIWWRPFNFG
jgi:hypothetical protein